MREGTGTPAWGGVERAMADFRRRLAWLTLAAHGVRHLTFCCLIWGCVVIILRAALGLPAAAAWWGLLALPASALLAWWSSRDGGPDDAAVRAFFDHRLRCGGLWMASGVALEAWRQALPQPALDHLPRPHWRAAPSLWRLFGALSFVLACGLLPGVSEGVDDPRRLEIDGPLDTLSEQVKVLEEDHWLDEPTASHLHEGLEALRREASGEDPAAAFETLDQLQEMARWSAAEAAQVSLEAAARLATAEAVVNSVAQQGAMSEDGAQALVEMADLLDGASEGSPWLEPELAAALQQAAAAASTGDMSDALGAGREALQKRLERLQAAGLLDAASLQGLSQAMRQAGDQALEETLRRHPAEASRRVLEGMGRAGFGRGGIERGPGHAPLTVRDGAEFTPQLEAAVLPAGSLGDLTRSQVVAEGWAAPSDDPSATAPSTAVGLRSSAAEGGGAWTHTLLPKHRQAVQDFFSPAAVPTDEPTEDAEASPPNPPPGP